MNYLIKNARICDPSTDRDETGDICIEDGIIRQNPRFPSTEYQLINGPDLIVTPGFVDIHVHFREPGAETSETMITGAEAAAKGGFTDVVTMPNTTPPIDSPELVTALLELAVQSKVVVHPSACATAGRAGKSISDMHSLKKAGACCFTDDGAAVADNSLMQLILATAKETNTPVLQHAVNPLIAPDGVIRQCPLAEKAGLAVFDPDSEISIVRRDIELAARTGGHIHFQHLSTSGAITEIRQALSKHIKVTCEATPHHLALSVEDIKENNADFKMNPPLGTASDRQALIEAVADGTISCLATDHAPHSKNKKSGGFAKAAFGVTGLETAAAVTYDILVLSGRISPLQWTRLWTEAPARIIGATCLPITAGTLANISVFRTNISKLIRRGDFASKSDNSPFVGRTVQMEPLLTLCRGRTTWNALNC